MRRKKIIQNSYFPTEEFYREFNLTWRYRGRIIQYVMIFLLSFISFIFILLKDYNFSFKYNIFLIVVLVFNFIHDRETSNYKRLLISCNHDVPTYVTTFDSNSILIETGNNKQEYDYSLIKKIIEGEHIMILKLPSRLGIIVDKNNMVEGTMSELRKLLLDKCDVKKIHKVPSYIDLLKAITSVFTIIVFCISLVLFITK